MSSGAGLRARTVPGRRASDASGRRPSSGPHVPTDDSEVLEPVVVETSAPERRRARWRSLDLWSAPSYSPTSPGHRSKRSGIAEQGAVQLEKTGTLQSGSAVPRPTPRSAADAISRGDCCRSRPVQAPRARAARRSRLAEADVPAHQADRDQAGSGGHVHATTADRTFARMPHRVEQRALYGRAPDPAGPRPLRAGDVSLADRHPGIGSKRMLPTTRGTGIVIAAAGSRRRSTPRLATAGLPSR